MTTVQVKMVASVRPLSCHLKAACLLFLCARPIGAFCRHKKVFGTNIAYIPDFLLALCEPCLYLHSASQIMTLVLREASYEHARDGNCHASASTPLDVSIQVQAQGSSRRVFIHSSVVATPSNPSLHCSVFLKITIVGVSPSMTISISSTR